MRDALRVPVEAARAARAWPMFRLRGPVTFSWPSGGARSAPVFYQFGMSRRRAWRTVAKVLGLEHLEWAGALTSSVARRTGARVSPPQLRVGACRPHPFHTAVSIALTKRSSSPVVAQELAETRILFDLFVRGGVVRMRWPSRRCRKRSAGLLSWIFTLGRPQAYPSFRLVWSRTVVLSQ